jgi:hypothetical protein
MLQSFRKLRRSEQASVVFALVIGSVVVAGVAVWITAWVIRGAVRYPR